MAQIPNAQRATVERKTQGIGMKPNSTRRNTICIGLINAAAHFMKMKLLPQMMPSAAKAIVVRRSIMVAAPSIDTKLSSTTWSSFFGSVFGGSRVSKSPMTARVSSECDGSSSRGASAWR